MTNYIDNTKEPKREKKKTIFRKLLDNNFKIELTQNSPLDWDNVEFIGHDIFYGDVFKAWDNDPNNFIIYFGEKGDEFE